MQSLPGKIPMLLLLLCLSLPGTAQKDTLWNRTDGNGLKQGYWRKYYPDGRILYRGYFVDNKPAGMMRRYYDNGNIKAELFYSGDTARATMYFRNGRKGACGRYVGQERDSIWSYFSYYTGRLSCREHYRMGMKEGPTLNYFPGGNVAEIVNWSMDRRQGPWERFYEDSTLRLSAGYESDSLNGPYRLYSPNHVLILSGRYRNGRMEGDWKFYDDEGKLLHTLSYRNGELLNQAEMMNWANEFIENAEKNQGKFPEPDIGNFFEKSP